MISDAHEGIKAAVPRALSAPGSPAGCASYGPRRQNSAPGSLRTCGNAFAQDDDAAVKAHRRQVADQLRPRVPKLSAFMDEAEADVLAYMSFPEDHRTMICSNDPIARLNGEIKRRTEVIGIFLNEASVFRLVGAILLQ